MDQGTAVGRELFSGMFEEFPNLKFIHTMFVGNLFAVQNLTYQGARSRPRALRLHFPCLLQLDV